MPGSSNANVGTHYARFCWPRSSLAPIMLQANRFCWIQSSSAPIMLQADRFCWPRSSPAPIMLQADRFCWLQSSLQLSLDQFCLHVCPIIESSSVHVRCSGGGHKLRLSGKELSRQSDHSFLRVSFNNQFVPLYCLF